jgi:predicted amidohydrolase YtcJ
LRLSTVGLFAALLPLVACDPRPIADPALAQSDAASARGKVPDHALGPSYVFINGNIITMDPERSIASAIAVDGDRIVAVGSNGEVARLSRSNTQIVNLKGRTVLPGIVDAHTHLFTAPQAFDLDVEGAHTLALRHGITTLALMSISPAQLPEMQAFAASGKLVVRTSLYLNYTNNCGGFSGDWWKAHPPTRVPGERLRIGGIKLFADGGTCHAPAVSQEFSPGSGFGDLFHSASQIATAVRAAELTGHQVVVHAIGDRAVRAALDGIGAALGGRPNVLRHRIDHNELVPDDLIPRYSQLGIIPVLFGYHHPGVLSPKIPGRNACPPFERNAFYAAFEGNTRAILDGNPGLPVAWHGDDPSIPPVSPMQELFNMVTRIRVYSNGDRCAPDPWMLKNRITVMEGLTMMTINSAYAIFREKEVGSLEVGKFADLLIMSDNPLEVDPQALFDVDVRMTMSGGQIVYCSPGHEEICSAAKTN